MQTDVDVDIGNTYVDELLPAFVGPIELTESAKEKFGSILDTRVEYLPEHNFACLLLDGNEDEIQEKWELCTEFFYALAGYIEEEIYDSWFIDQG